MRPRLEYNDYQLMGYEVYLSRRGKVYKLYLDPRLKLTISRDGKKKRLPLKKVKGGDLYREFKIESIKSPLFNGILWMFGITSNYPLYNLEELKVKHEDNATVFEEKQLRELMSEYGITRAQKMFDGIYLETGFGTDLYLPTCGIKNDGMVVELQTASTYQPEFLEMK